MFDDDNNDIIASIRCQIQQEIPTLSQLKEQLSNEIADPEIQMLRNFRHLSLEQLDTNNQPIFGCNREGAMMMRCHQGGTRGLDFFLLFWAANGATKERERGTGPWP